MSTSRTGRSPAARAVARLIAVVVLPTPPFWLAIARTRVVRAASALAMCNVGDPQNDGVRRGSARESVDAHVPVRRSRRQFRRGVGALRRQQAATPGDERSSKAEQLW